MTTPVDSNSFEDTRTHIARVALLLGIASGLLRTRAQVHDLSKLEEPEKSAFDRLKGKLATMKYGSEEYRACLRSEKPAIDHHYAHNSHHPEHWPKRETEHGHRCHAAAQALSGIATDKTDLPEGLRAALIFAAETLELRALECEANVNGMSLFDFIEMIIDWKAASERMQDGGDIRKSIEHNTGRFSLSPQLVSLLQNTVTEMGW